MTFTLRHTLVDTHPLVEQHQSPQGTFFTVEARGTFEMRYPGNLSRTFTATVDHTVPRGTLGGSTDVTPPPTTIDGFPTGGGPGGIGGVGGGFDPHKPFEKNADLITLTLHILTPDGRPFTANRVTLVDIERWRDPRGAPFGPWSFLLTGRSKNYALSIPGETVGEPKCHVNLLVTEKVPSSSAAPLVPRTKLGREGRDFTFDLHRVGRFEAQLSSVLLVWRGTMALLDPEGREVASTTGSRLTAPITLPMLAASRDTAGRARLWTLRVRPQATSSGISFTAPTLTATVVGEARVGTSVLLDRINRMLGPQGSALEIKAVNSGTSSNLLLTMTVTQEVSAEAIEMLGLFGDEVVVGRTIVLGSTAERVPLVHNINGTLKANGLRVTKVSVSFRQEIGGVADAPVFRLDVRTQGNLELEALGTVVARIRPKNDRLTIDIGLRLGTSGLPEIVTATSEGPLDVDAANRATLASLGLVDWGAESYESDLNDEIKTSLAKLFSGPGFAAELLMTLQGAHFDYRRIALEGDTVVFEYVAPLEPDPHPRRHYAPAIGRTFVEQGPGLLRFEPPTLGDTWDANDLAKKIHHVVVVMMENRSFDHVLGYRARAPFGEPCDGLTDTVVERVQRNGSVSEHVNHVVRLLRNAEFDTNELEMRTQLPASVGHEFTDVAEQLAHRLVDQSPQPGPVLNAPTGFVSNFLKVNHFLGGSKVKADDVLGYYDDQDLPMFAYLAQHYAYADQYFCSHPGPTLPNRMYSLAGDVQYDRYGGALLRNNHGADFLLSRAANVFDVLSKFGVSWRVYESSPSVAMVRMFARYAGDDVNVRPIDELERDLERVEVTNPWPAFTMIEPAMHHDPQDDDHPPADMYRGQHFVKRVYDAFRARPDVWERTLMIITYDEHGGMYDHVVPPLAEVVTNPRQILGDVAVAGTATAAATATTGTTAGAGVAGALGTVGAVRAVGTVGAVGRLTDVFSDGTPTSPPIEPPRQVQVPYGVRVPTFVVSPWVTPGKGPDVLLDHCSLIKTVLARFLGDRKPFLSERVHASHSFEPFVNQPAPRLDVPASPTLRKFKDQTGPRGGLDLGAIADLVSAGTVTLAGTDSPPKPTRITTPALTRRALREGTADFHTTTGFVARLLGR